MKKLGKRIAGVILLLLAILGIGFGLYISQYYKAGDSAHAILQDETLVQAEKNWLCLDSASDEVGLIFYPGAKVETGAYLPLLERLRENGVNCFLVKMPLHLAILGADRAEDVVASHPEIQSWYMAGHSMGGAFASAYAAKHREQIAGVVLLGAYLYGDYPVEQTITIYGSEDQVLNRDKITYETNVHVIDGGNHALFGDYGMQKGDGTAAISAQEQWEQTAEMILDFISLDHMR